MTTKIGNTPAKPLKIEIERNVDLFSKEPFFITVNGNRLKNVKRFYIDLDKDKLIEKSLADYGENTRINSWAYGIEYEDYPYDDEGE